MNGIGIDVELAVLTTNLATRERFYEWLSRLVRARNSFVEARRYVIGEF